MLPTLSKTLDVGDYARLPDEVARVGHGKNMFGDVTVFQHEHRTWEYAVVLAAAGSRADLVGKRCLDVGGGTSLLGGLLAWGGAHVTVNDFAISPGQQEVRRRFNRDGTAHTPGGFLDFLEGDFTGGTPRQFDFVACVSVIEHVPDDEAFFRSLLRAVAPGGTLALTCDFHASGVPLRPDQIRIYHREHMERWGNSPGFHSPGGFDYADRGGPILDGYNFASLVLRRNP